MSLFKKKGNNSKKKTQTVNYYSSLAECHRQVLDNTKDKESLFDYFIGNSERLLEYYSPQKSSTRAKIFNSYKKFTSQDYENDSSVSAKCLTCDESINFNEQFCQHCGNTNGILTFCDQVNYGEPINDKPQFTYDKRHHFKELINQAQGKETTAVPESIIESVRSDIKKYRIPKSSINISIIRNILKRHNLNKYYEHAANILNIINPNNSLVFTLAQEDKLYYMFDVIQEPFILFCPGTRSNLINYKYIFYKFCQILRLEKEPIPILYEDHFPLLKCDYKLYQLECIWKRIITWIQENGVKDDIDWRYLPLNI